jgi:hypothetical protein
MFPQMVEVSTSFPQVNGDAVPLISALVSLVEAVPHNLLVLTPGQYAELTASTAFLLALPERFQASRASHVAPMNMTGFDHNPIAMVRAAMAACPDEAAGTDTVPLAFIADDALRESIRLDLSAANQNLANGEWKGATVLGGAAIEALLLWALYEHEQQNPGARQAAVSALRVNSTFTRNPPGNLDEWGLSQYIEVAASLGIIEPESAIQARQAKDFRNLIHPGKAQREAQKCDRGTALSALAAVELVVRDLTA